MPTQESAVLVDTLQSDLLPTPEGPLSISPSPDRPGRAPRLSLIVPTYNEAKNVTAMVTLISGLLDRALGSDYEIIIVDDDSPDRTWEAAAGLMIYFPRLSVMRRRTERGLSSAVIRGWQAARGQVLAVIDGDLQHPPEVILELLAAIDGGADLAVASRHVEGGGVSSWSIARRVLSRGAQMVGLILLPGVVGKVSDPMSGYFMVRREAIAGTEMHPLGYKILIEVIARGTIDVIAEVGYEFRERVLGESKVSARQYIDYLRHLGRLRMATGFSLRPWKLLSSLPIQRFVRFGAVGLSGVIVDMGVLYLLHDPHSLGWGLSLSKVFGAELAILNNFFWNDRWTFRDLAGRQRGRSAALRRLLKFNVVCLLGLAINVSLLNLFSGGLHVGYLFANVMAIGVVTLWNFWMNLKLSWRVTG